MGDSGTLLSALRKDQLVGMVSAARKHNLSGTAGSWNDYVKAHCPKFKLTDPSKHSDKVLSGFLLSLTAHPATTSGAGSAAGDAPVQPSAEDAARFVRRYLRWQKYKQAEKDMRLSDVTARSAGAANGHAEAGPSSAAAAAADGAAAAAQGGGGRGVSPAWSLVQRVRRHPSFAKHYSLPSYLRGWKCTRRRQPVLTSPPRLLAVDCEMCKTDCDDNALLGVSVIDEHGKVIYQSLVQPRGTVLDYRTALTGVTEEALRGVAVRRRDVRRDIGALLSPQTVLVGHALHHDLAALRLDHHPIIDTSLLFSYAALPDVTPSLKDLAQVVLKVSMRTKSEGRHDMVEDAVVAMQLVAHEMAQPRPTPPLPTLELKVPKEQLRKLLVHSIPSGTTPRDVAAVFELLGVPAEAIEGDVSSRKLHAVFKHPGDANEAFKRIPGRWETDNGGRRVKTAPLPGADSGRSVRVRQMACHGGMAFREPAAAAPPAPTAEDSARSSKKGKRPAASSVEAAAATANGHTSDGGSGSARKKRKHDKPPPAK